LEEKADFAVAIAGSWRFPKKSVAATLTGRQLEHHRKAEGCACQARISEPRGAVDA
jgi:hypothetical protein